VKYFAYAFIPLLRCSVFIVSCEKSRQSQVEELSWRTCAPTAAMAWRGRSGAGVATALKCDPPWNVWVAVTDGFDDVERRLRAAAAAAQRRYGGDVRWIQRVEHNAAGAPYLPRERDTTRCNARRPFRHVNARLQAFYGSHTRTTLRFSLLFFRFCKRTHFVFRYKSCNFQNTSVKIFAKSTFQSCFFS